MIPARDTAAVVLAAGFSVRMGRFKPLLPLGGRPMIRWGIELFQGCGITEIHVVTGHRHEDMACALTGSGVDVVVNPDFPQGMFSSVKAGIRSLHPECRAFFVLPADIPLVRPATVRQLLEGFDPDRTDVAIPSFTDRPGHPPIIASRLCPAILAADEAGGLRAALARWQNNTLQVAVADRFILHDADGLHDYQALQAACLRRDIPDADECRQILAARGPDAERIGRHGLQVARVAGALADALGQAGIQLDTGLIRAAALVHDLAKGMPDHARAGAERLRLLGFAAVAEIVACHHDIIIDPAAPIGAAEVVFLADKRVAGDRIVPLEDRFAAALKRYWAIKDARVNIHHRRQQALAVQRRIETAMGRSVDGLLEEQGDTGDER